MKMILIIVRLLLLLSAVNHCCEAAITLGTTNTAISNGAQLQLVCTVDALTGTVGFEFPPGNPVGICTGSGAACSSASYTLSQDIPTKKTYLTIDNFELSTAGGTWKCYQGAESDTFLVELTGTTDPENGRIAILVIGCLAVVSLVIVILVWQLACDGKGPCTLIAIGLAIVCLIMAVMDVVFAALWGSQYGLQQYGIGLIIMIFPQLILFIVVIVLKCK